MISSELLHEGALTKNGQLVMAVVTPLMLRAHTLRFVFYCVTLPRALPPSLETINVPVTVQGTLCCLPFHL